MKKILFLAVVLTGFTACQKSDFEENYADPGKIATTNVEKQFTGMIVTNREYVVPSYWNYFVVLRTSINRYVQAVGWENGANQYIPPAAGVSDRWNNYYNFLAQFRELEKVYNALPAESQAQNRIFMIAATVYFYDHTQKVIDLHGDIPWTAAGKLSTNGGDYANSYPAYDRAQDIYTKMLDDLKGIAAELNTIEVPAGIFAGFKTQDLINKGDNEKWKRYVNSLRLRMLMRVSDATDFSARAASEIAEILGNPSQYPLVTENSQNIQINIFDLNSAINSQGFQSGLEDWNGNIAGAEMIDHMKASADPRLPAIFEPGANAAGEFTGLDQMLTGANQASLIAGGTIAIYNRSTISRNDFFPGMLINAAEISFYLSEYYLKNGDDAAAKTAYENGIRQSTDFYYWVRTLTNDNTSPALDPLDPADVDAYIASPGVDWDAAADDDAKLKLIATEKWINYNVIQPLESWSELRRLDKLDFDFEIDNSSAQQQPPTRWFYPGSESTYNSQNYEAVRSSDNLTTRLFWDVQ
ncbi:MAG: SusD/RagB family nutrient-binding outer membrane lipoprotein [Chitinophagaceae bacterium]|nr:SusD/RagB family nutrient-binding outer membrane lipoprotein [Chitinophagaceae bacterium]